jgi:hypothetical protein
MREIKFRVWCEFRKEMIYISGLLDFKFWISGYCDSEENTWPDNMEQYTGIKDKDEKGIYEGDYILKNIGYPGKSILIVSYWIPAASFYMYDKDNPADYFDIWELESEKYEIIGNIHEGINGKYLL